MKHVFLFLLLTFPAIAQQQVTIRVCTYNVLNYGVSEPVERQAALRRVIDSVKADILVLQAINGTAGAEAIGAEILAGYQLAPFVDGPDTDNLMAYDSSKVAVIDHTVIPTELRNIDRWLIIIKGTEGGGDTLNVYGCHFKAGDTQADEDQRGREAQALVQRIHELQDQNAVAAFNGRILAGDLNLYSSDEPADTTLHPFGGSRTFVDPLLRDGTWHNNAAFADIHTQSPRVRSFGGGITGGLHDRFDFIFLSPVLYMLHRTEQPSYVTFGNDGQHMNDSINRMPNTAVDSVTAQALHDASDHLPVYLDLVFPKTASGVEERKRVPVEMNLSRRNNK